MATATASGVVRANRFMLILLGLQRLSYLLPALLTLGHAGYRDNGLNTALVVLTIAANLAMFWLGTRGGWFPEWLVWSDVAWAALLTVVVSFNSGAAHTDSSIDWSGRVAQAAAALAGAAIVRVAYAGLAVGLLLVAHATADVIAGSSWLACLSCLNGIAWFAIIIGFAARYLRRQGTVLDQLNDERLASTTRQAETQARLEHFRVLHDKVLTTLTVIARGGLEQNPEQMRQRCARDADFVRRYLSDERPPDVGTLAGRLLEVIDGAQELGLRVHYNADPLPPLPTGVGEAIASASQEALNNVVLHSGTRTAWVTATAGLGGVTVRVVDRGIGFVVDAPRDGSGLSRSVVERLRSVGGIAQVESAPGDGTCVELAWPA